MKDYTVDDPKFSEKITITEITDTNHADNINKAPKQVFENTLFLKKSKVSADGGDVSDTVIQSAADVEDEYPIPAAGDTPKTLLGKTKKFFESIKNWMTGVCLLGHIVNNCVTDRSDLPLSAAQGKALMDAITVLNTKTSKTGHIHDDRYYTEAEVDAKFNQRILVPSPTSSSGGISTYQIKPQIADQGIFCLCRSELYIVRLGQSGGAFNAYDLIQISDHTATINATVSLTTDKKALIFKCSQFENPIFIGRF